MFVLAAIGAGILLLFAVFLVWGALHLRHSIRGAESAIAAVRLDEIPALRDECIRVFQDAYGDALDLDDFEGAAQILSGRLDDHESLKQPFARDDCYWHFVLPVGAFLGELLRVHANGTWRVASDEVGGGIELAIPIRDELAQTFPFHKVLKHVTSGDPGDVYAYLMSSLELEKVLDHLEADSGE